MLGFKSFFSCLKVVSEGIVLYRCFVCARASRLHANATKALQKAQGYLMTLYTKVLPLQKVCDAAFYQRVV